MPSRFGPLLQLDPLVRVDRILYSFKTERDALLSPPSGVGAPLDHSQAPSTCAGVARGIGALVMKLHVQGNRIFHRQFQLALELLVGYLEGMCGKYL